MLNYKFVRGCMQALAEGIALPGEMSPVMKENIKVVTSPKLWSVGNQAIIERTLEDLVYAPADMVNIERPQIPAEMWAGVIAMFVKPVNWYVASSWICKKTIRTADSLSHPNGNQSDSEVVTSGKLNAQIMQAYSTGDAEEFCEQFNARVGLSVAKAISTAPASTSKVSP